MTKEKLPKTIKLKTLKEIKETLTCPDDRDRTPEGCRFHSWMYYLAGRKLRVRGVSHNGTYKYQIMNGYHIAEEWIAKEGELSKQDLSIIEELDEMLKHHIEYNYLFNKALPLTKEAK